MTELQLKLISTGEFLFRLMDMGVFKCYNHDIGLTPAELCAAFDITVPDCCQFMRIKDYENGFQLEWRNYGANAIRINLRKLG